MFGGGVNLPSIENESLIYTVYLNDGRLRSLLFVKGKTKIDSAGKSILNHKVVIPRPWIYLDKNFIVNNMFFRNVHVLEHHVMIDEICDSV